MPKLTYNCPVCSKQLKLKKEFRIGDTRMFEYTCGHVFSHDVTHIDKSKLDFTSVDGSGKQARPYQEDTVQFILESDFNTIVAHQMRLGKTPCSLLALKNKYAERTPVLILVKGANLWQWIREYKVWCDALPNGIFPVIGGQAWIPHGFSAYIMSMDTFSLNPKCKCGHSYHEEKCSGAKKTCDCKTYQPAGEGIRDKLKKIPFKLIIADEAHSFKNTDSNRSQALVEFINYLNTGEEDLTIHFTCTRCKNEFDEIGKIKFDKRIGHKVISKQTKCPSCGQYCYVQQQHRESEEKKSANKPCGLILLTGTPVLNRAEEYFVPLNLVSPEKFSSIERFRRQWLEQDSKGRWNRVKRYLIDDFKNEIKPYLIRYEKEDVYKELPALNKIFTIIEPDRETYAKEYNRILDKMEAKLADKANPTFWDMQDDMMALRRICGMMKTTWTADYLEAAALESSAKYAVGIHHESVRDFLYLKLGGDLNCYKLSGQDNAEKKDWIMRNWEHSNKQFLIINMLAGGVGMDFHYCDNVLVLERQWNSEMESQFEFRFYNPDLSIKKNSTQVEYILAKGTLDEWWYDMVEAKRQVVGETVYNNWDLQSDQSTFKQLVEKTVGSRL